jgi:hypothetical protein
MTETNDALVLLWETELDRLDLEVLWVERLLSAATHLQRSDWVPPEPAGPMPIHLLPRALEINKRQTEVQNRILKTMRMTSQHRTYVERMSNDDAEVPRYVDISG